MVMEGDVGLPAGFGKCWEWRGVPNQAGNSAVVLGVISISLAQNTPALLRAHRRAGVSGGKEAWMLRQVEPDYPPGLGVLGVARRSQSGG
jgi:hypothetical protein